MKNAEFHVRGSQESINELIADLKKHTDELKFSEIKEYQPGFFDRDSYRNSALFDVVITSVSLNVVSSFIYDLLKSYIQEKKIQLIEEKKYNNEEDNSDDGK